jgi:hypothetical protein
VDFVAHGCLYLAGAVVGENRYGKNVGESLPNPATTGLLEEDLSQRDHLLGIVVPRGMVWRYNT